MLQIPVSCDMAEGNWELTFAVVVSVCSVCICFYMCADGKTLLNKNQDRCWGWKVWRLSLQVIWTCNFDLDKDDSVFSGGGQEAHFVVRIIQVCTILGSKQTKGTWGCSRNCANQPQPCVK